MAIDYNWVCTACGATNAAGTSNCAKCRSNAITSGFEIEQRSSPKPASELPIGNSPPLSRFRKLFLGTCLVMVTSGVLLERPTVPPMLAWYIGVGLMAVGGLPLLLFAATIGGRK
jgi:hypothetical protein